VWLQLYKYARGKKENNEHCEIGQGQDIEVHCHLFNPKARDKIQ
jgi:hypothetical protein